MTIGGRTEPITPGTQSAGLDNIARFKRFAKEMRSGQGLAQALPGLLNGSIKAPSESTSHAASQM